MTTQTLMSRAESIQRSEQKLRLILEFLRINKWSHQEVLQQLINVNSRQAIHKTLLMMESKGLIKRHAIDNGFGPVMTIWGITNHGVMMSFAEDEAPRDIRAFERSKLKPTQVNHALDIQLAQVRAEAAGWSEWRTAGFSQKGIKSPDAVARRPDGVLVSFEIERSLKALRRYPEILVSHLAARKAGLWSEIYYLMPDESMKKRVRRCFDVINQARYQKQTIQITAAHKAPFKFFTYEELWDVNYQQEKQNEN